MKKYSLSDMKGGWFVGNFDPAIIKTSSCEAACKRYKKGDREKKHLHKEAKEITLIAQGKAQMNGVVYEANDILLLEENEPSDFFALEDTVTFVFKIPSVPGDKYLV